MTPYQITTHKRKFRKFLYHGQNREGIETKLREARALLAAKNPNLLMTSRWTVDEYAERLERIVDALKRQLYALDNKNLPFSVARTDLYVGTNPVWYVRFLNDEDEVMYILKMGGK